MRYKFYFLRDNKLVQIWNLTKDEVVFHDTLWRHYNQDVSSFAWELTFKD